MMDDMAVAAVLDAFADNFRSGSELGASLSVWRDGSEWISRGHGWCERERQRPWTRETLVPVYSASKGPAAAALLLALVRHGLGPETPVREVWPAFPVAEADFGHLLSHQCGLAALDHRVSAWDHEGGVAAVEAQAPAWRPGSGHGYHPRSWGILLDEPVRRLAGVRLGEFWWREIAVPLGLEFWLGLPERECGRVARLYPGRLQGGGQSEFVREFTTPGTLTSRAFHCFTDMNAVHEMNTPRAWSAGWPAMGGIGTASALAGFYQAAIGAIPSPLPESVRGWLARARTAGPDRVLCCDTVFTCGCQQDPLAADGRKARRLFGPSPAAFGHSGAGGSHAFGDPASGISFAYVMNQMQPGIFPGGRCQALIDALCG